MTLEQLEDMLKAVLSLVSMEERYETRQNIVRIVVQDGVTKVRYVITGSSIVDGDLVLTIDPEFEGDYNGPK